MTVSSLNVGEEMYRIVRVSQNFALAPVHVAPLHNYLFFVPASSGYTLVHISIFLFDYYKSRVRQDKTFCKTSLYYFFSRNFEDVYSLMYSG